MIEERPWLKNYAKGVPANIDVDMFPTVVDYVTQMMEKFSHRPAFSCMGKEISYSKVDKQSTQLAAYLQSRGLEPGDKIALMMPNLLQYPIALFACFKAGLIVVNTNPLYTPREMLHQFTDSGVEAIIIAENFAANLEKIRDKTSINTIIITSIGEMLGAVKGTVVNFAVRRIKRMVPKHSLENTVTFNEAVRQGKQFKIKPFDNTPERVIVHQYTGGTTGVSKGAMLTNKNLIANMLQIKAILTSIQEGEEIDLSPLPMYHIFAFTVNCLAMMYVGALTVLVVNPRDRSSIYKEFKRYKITLMTGVNTLFNAMLHDKQFASLDFSHLKITVAGGMALQSSVANKWLEVTGCHLTQGYGLTETSPVVTVNLIDGSGKPDSIGMPVPSTDVRIITEQGTPAAIDQVGEIQVKGPQVMPGYYNREEETRNSFSDGWLKTGDIGRMDADGFFYIVDRKKDMINVSGFNVFPNEIEEVVSGHPKVLEVAAIGIPDERSGEVVKLFVIKKDKSLTVKELLEFCKENMTGYKVPREIEFRKELPKSNIGKILRRELREE
jgi:long-chain acyl-CoA synthetase